MDIRVPARIKFCLNFVPYISFYKTENIYYSVGNSSVKRSPVFKLSKGFFSLMFNVSCAYFKC